MILLRTHLDKTKFKIRTNHNSYKWIPNLTDSTGLFTLWRLRVFAFVFDVFYWAGKTKLEMGTTNVRLSIRIRAPKKVIYRYPKSTCRTTVAAKYGSSLRLAMTKFCWTHNPILRRINLLLRKSLWSNKQWISIVELLQFMSVNGNLNSRLMNANVLFVNTS